MRLDHLLLPEHVLLDIPARTREEVLYFVAQALERSGLVNSAEDLVDHLLEREKLGATVVVLAPTQGDSPVNPQLVMGGQTQADQPY